MIVEGKCGSGGGGSLKDIIYDKVFNSGFATTYSITAYGSRCTITKGQISVDTDNKRAYLYLDVTETSAASSPYAVASTTLSANYFPRNQTATTTPIPLYTDDLSDEQNEWFIQSGTSPYYIEVAKSSANSHYIVYGMWTYGK